ncbi:MAG: hypothetical protein IJR31_08535 [Lachnospiraceae bacterium]|nr:hypothetical protein [Lachnospiraceae bacterium]
MLSVLAGTINTLIDSAFVTRRLDAKALAAVSVNMPLFLIICVVGCFFGIGAFIAASKTLGKNDIQTAGRYLHSAVFYSVVTGVLITMVGVFFSDIVASFLCSDKELMPMVSEYCRVTMIGSLAYLLAYIPAYFLQIGSKARSMTVMMVITIATDVIFDWLFLYVFDWGVGGAALASVLSMAISAIYGFIKMQMNGGVLHISLGRIRPFDLRNILLYGSTSAVGNLMGVLRIFFLNRIIYAAGGTEGLAAWAVINALYELADCITVGVPRTASPMLGIYINGHDNEGVRLMIRQEMKSGITLSVVFTLFITVFSGPIGSFFKLDQSVFTGLLCLGLSIIITAPCAVLGAYYNMAKRIWLSNLSMICRSFVFVVLFAWILRYTSLPIWLFLPASMIVSLFITVMAAMWVASRSKGGKHELSGILLLDQYLEKAGKVKGFSIVASDETICKASEDITDFCKEHGMDKKTAARLGLSMEEVMTVMSRRSLKKENDPVDVRIYSVDDQIGLSIMCSGHEYNPFKEAEENEEDDFNIGVRMINKVSKNCYYVYALGINVLTVEF